MEQTFRVEIERVPVEKIELQPLARCLLDVIKRAYQDPALEAEYQEWLRERKEKAQ